MIRELGTRKQIKKKGKNQTCGHWADANQRHGDEMVNIEAIHALEPKVRTSTFFLDSVDIWIGLSGQCSNTCTHE